MYKVLRLIAPVSSLFISACGDPQWVSDCQSVFSDTNPFRVKFSETESGETYRIGSKETVGYYRKFYTEVGHAKYDVTCYSDIDNRFAFIEVSDTAYNGGTGTSFITRTGQRTYDNPGF